MGRKKEIAKCTLSILEGNTAVFQTKEVFKLPERMGVPIGTPEGKALLAMMIARREEQVLKIG
jgi:hypothetical protein